MSNMSTQFKFTLFGLSGSPKAHYLVDQHTPDLSSPKKEVVASHHIIVADRSGSMWNDIAGLKDMLLKLLTVTEYDASNMFVSLISYSSSGDCVLHFDHVPVKAVMETDSKYQSEIKRIRSSGMTCISQALRMTKEVIRSNEVTGVTLHSDGYANDPYPSLEYSSVQKICDELASGNVFINTVAYSDYSDFKFLSRIANSVSGACIKANSVKGVYDAFVATASILGGKTVPSIVFEPEGSDYQVFVSKSLGRINGSASSLKVSGVSSDDDVTVYRFRKVSEEQYNKSSASVIQKSKAVLAFAKAQLAEGNINTAKFAMFSACRHNLTTQHYRAITNNQLAEMSKSIQAAVFDSSEEIKAIPELPTPIGGSVTVVGVVGLLEHYINDIEVNQTALASGYKLRGVKRLDGVRGPDGKVERPWLETKPIDSGDYVKIASFEVNRDSPTIQLKIIRKVKLVDRASGNAIDNVAGIDVGGLSTFKNYTIVGDGTLNVDKVCLRVSSEEAKSAIMATGAASINGIGEVVIDLSGLPVIPFDLDVDASGLATAYLEILRAKTLSSILTAIRGKTATKYTAEQIAELSKHYLTPALNISFPTVNEYEDLHKAIDEGTIDTRVSYKVQVGNTDIVNAGCLMSANAFLKRMYEAFDIKTGAAIDDDPKFAMWGKGVSFREKKLSARTKVTKSDLLQKEIFDDFLGVKKTGVVAKILSSALFHGSADDLKNGGPVALEQAEDMLDDRIEDLYRKHIVSLAFYIGATGLMPDSVSNVKAETADEIQKRVPDIKLSKDEKEGTFFQVGDVLLTVYSTSEYFSTGKKAGDQMTV